MIRTNLSLKQLARYVERVALSVLVVLMLGACDVHEFPDGGDQPTTEPMSKCVLHLKLDTASMPLHTVINYEEDGSVTRTRSLSDPHDFRYIISIYRVNSRNSRDIGSPGTPAWKTLTYVRPGESRDLDFDIPLELPAGYYQIYAWGDFITAGTTDDRYYHTMDFAELMVRDDENGMHQGNKHEREAFRGEASVTIDNTMVAPASNDTIHIYSDMERPMARFRFIATDVDKFMDRLRAEAAENGDNPAGAPAHAPSLDDYTTVVRYTSYMPSTYNAILDVPVDSRIGRYFTGTISQINDISAELGHDFVFVNHREAAVQVALETYDRRTGQQISSTPTITVPLKRGHITEVQGAFLSSKVQGGMGINPDFDGSYTIIID